MITAIAFVFIGIHLCYYLIFLVIATSRNLNSTHRPPVSVVVCVKNGAQTLPDLLNFLVKQQYPNYEIVVVDDFSTDESRSIIQSYDGVVLIKVKVDLPGKKQALYEGIKEASHDLILVTDADCYGTSPLWINQMVEKMGSKKIVFGYAPLANTHNMASIFAAYEAWIIGLQYLSFARWGFPYMGVGRNMMYKKQLFLDHPLESHADLISGDDDLFIQEAGNGSNVAICVERQAQMWSDAPKNWSSYISMKTRHLSTASRYQKKHIIALSLFTFSHFGSYAGILWLLVGGNFNTAIFCYLTKVIAQILLSFPVAKKMDETRQLKWVPLLDPIFGLVMLWLSPKVLRPNSVKNWSQ